MLEESFILFICLNVQGVGGGDNEEIIRPFLECFLTRCSRTIWPLVPLDSG